VNNFILFGFKGCGKTHYGRLLAARLNYDFIDTDHVIESNHGNLSCREISEKIGEAEFRIIETKVIKSLHVKKNAIISVGGGTVLDPDNVRILKNIGTLIYLEENKETLRQRMFNAIHLPSFIDKDDPIGSFEKTYQERKQIYENIDAIKLNISGKTEQEVLTILGVYGE